MSVSTPVSELIIFCRAPFKFVIVSATMIDFANFFCVNSFNAFLMILYSCMPLFAKPCQPLMSRWAKLISPPPIYDSSSASVLPTSSSVWTRAEVGLVMHFSRFPSLTGVVHFHTSMNAFRPKIEVLAVKYVNVYRLSPLSPMLN